MYTAARRDVFAGVAQLRRKAQEVFEAQFTTLCVALVLGSWGNTTRDAVRSKERCCASR